MIKKIVLSIFTLFSVLTYGEDMEISIEKPIKDNLIVINIKGVEKPDYSYHRVVRGDTLGGIAVVYDKGVKKLVDINELKNPNLIYPKQKIYLENKKPVDIDKIPEYHVVKAGENLIEIAYYYELDFRDIIRLNGLRGYVVQPNQKLKLK